MKHSLILRFFSSLLALAAFSSCSSGIHDFAGGLSPQSRATITSGGNVRLRCLDGQKPPKDGFCYAMSFKGHTTLHVAPGRHKIGVGYYYEPFSLMFADALQNASVNQFSGGGTVRPGTQVMRGFVSTTTPVLEINAQSGHTYTLMEERTGRRWKVYVKDSCNGRETTNRSHSVEGAMSMETKVF